MRQGMSKLAAKSASRQPSQIPVAGSEAIVKITPRLIALAMLSLIVSCGSSSHTPSSPTLNLITVSPTSPSVAAGLTQQFKAMGTYSDGSMMDLTSTATWTSSSTTVAVIASSGLATTKAQGSTTITAASGSVSGATTLQVSAATLTSITVTPPSPTMNPGTYLQFTATGKYTDGTTQNLTTTATWSSADSTIVSVGPTTGLGAAVTIPPPLVGAATIITATSGMVNGHTGVNVQAATLESIELSATNLTIAPGTSYQFSAYGIFSDGGKQDISNEVTWGSSSANFASISGEGLAKGITAGGTTISATMGSVSQNATLTVSGATISSIVVGPTTRSIAPLTELAFTAVGSFSDSSTQDITRDVTWASSNTGVANFTGLTSPGTITAAGAGSTHVTATLGATTSAPAALQVTSATLSQINLTTPTLNVAVGSAFEIGATGVFSDSTMQGIGSVVNWTSSNPAVASVNAFGNVNALTTGTSTISASLSGKSNSVNINVENATALTLSTTLPSIAPGTVSPFRAAATLADGNTQTVTNSMIWTSATPTVALAGNTSSTRGQAIALSAGSSLIAGLFDGLIASATVNVTDATLVSIAITPPSPSIALNGVQDFKATGTYSDGTTQVLTELVTWTSSNVQTAIISQFGVATPIAAGTSTITAQMGSVSATTTLTVQ